MSTCVRNTFLPIAVMFALSVCADCHGQSQVKSVKEKTSKTDPQLARWLKKFPQADLNRDGVLTRKEALTFRDQLKAKLKKQKSDKLPKATHANVRYGKHERNVLDVYLAKAKGPTPVFIFFHGGGFVAGDKQSARNRPIVQQCLGNGISVVSANYRFIKRATDDSPGVTYPIPMLDSMRAVQFVRTKAQEWNLDANRIAVSGSSAGAVICLWIGLRDDMADPKSKDPVSRQSTRVSAVIAYAGPTSLDPKVILKHVGGRKDIHPSIYPFFGIDDIEDLKTPKKQEMIREASAMSHVSKDDPPLYLVYGSTLEGTPLPATASYGTSIHHARFGKLLQDRCKEIGVPCRLKCRGLTPEETEIAFLLRVFAADEKK